jgi:hypothetical protein
MTRRLAVLACLVLAAAPAFAQTRDEKVRTDKSSVLDDGYWIYNDLPRAIDTAKRSDKPLMAVVRCIP